MASREEEAAVRIKKALEALRPMMEVVIEQFHQCLLDIEKLVKASKDSDTSEGNM